MELSWLEKFLQNHRTPWIVGGLTITLFLIANLPWQLDDYDQSWSGDSRRHGYAAGVPDFSDRLSYLAENSKTGSLETAGSILDLRPANRGDVDQGADCLCVSATRDLPIRVVAAKE